MTQSTTITPEEVMEKLMPVQDPELRMGIVDLGLVYDVKIDEDNVVDVIFTLTTPACPLGPLLIAQIQDAVMEIEALGSAHDGERRNQDAAGYLVNRSVPIDKRNVKYCVLPDRCLLSG